MVLFNFKAHTSAELIAVESWSFRLHFSFHCQVTAYLVGYCQAEGNSDRKMSGSCSEFLILGMAGFAGAAFGWPMKHFRGWNWEHVWVGQSLTSNVIYPLATLAVLWPLFRETAMSICPAHYLELILLGALWGVGGIGYGLSLNMLGLSFTYSVVFSVTTVCGALLPLWIGLQATPAHLFMFCFGLVLCVSGTLLLAQAGAGRSIDRLDSRKQIGSALVMPVPQLSYAASLILALAAGVFSASMGLALALNNGLVSRLTRLGVSSVIAPLIVWSPLGVGAGLVSISYGLVCAFRAGTLTKFHRERPIRNWALVNLMGVLGFGGMLLYGLGATGRGHPPANVAWATFMASYILSGNAIGLMLNEWKNCRRRTHVELFFGVVLLLGAIGALAAS